MTPDEPTPRDAKYWAEHTTELQVDDVADDAIHVAEDEASATRMTTEE